MPKVSLADLFQDWYSLLQAAEKYRDQRKMYVHLDKLQSSYDQLRDLEAERADLQARQQEITQRMGGIKEEGKLAAMETRQLLKGILGPRNEALVQFKVRPLRKRGPRKKASTETEPAP